MTTLPILTQHCRFCNHLLLATTRKLSVLPRRNAGAQDQALILPLTKEEDEGEEGEDVAETETDLKRGTRTKHTTLLLATTIPDRRPTLIRREDGIEKRVLLRCGRCRVVVGYYLDAVHWGDSLKGRKGGEEDGDGEEKPPAVYVLPGALVETEEMGGEGVGEREWRSWDV